MERGLLLLGREVRGLEQVEQRDGTSSSAAPSSAGRSRSALPRLARPRFSPWDGQSTIALLLDPHQLVVALPLLGKISPKVLDLNTGNMR